MRTPLLLVVLLLAGCTAPTATLPPTEAAADGADPQVLADAVAAAVRSALEAEGRELVLDVESVEAVEDGWRVEWSLFEGYETAVEPSGVLRVELYDVDGLAATKEIPVADVAPRYERWVVTSFVEKAGVRTASAGALHAVLAVTLADGRSARSTVSEGDYEGAVFAPVLKPFAERFSVEVVAWGAEGDEDAPDAAWVHLRVRCLVDGPEARLDVSAFTLDDEKVEEIETASDFRSDDFGRYYYDDGEGMDCGETPEDDLTVERWAALDGVPTVVGFDLPAPWDADPSWALDPAKRTDERPPFDT